MAEPRAFLNGRFVPASEAAVAATDAGFVQGVTVAEQLRTFGGRLFRLEEHLARLARSLAIVEVDADLSHDELAAAAETLVAGNHRLLAAGDDLGLAMFVTPGDYPPMAAGPRRRPTVCMHTFPLRFDLWAGKYARGESLVTTDVAQVPEACWPRELKCRSRMHYYLADRQAHRREPGSRALMRDEEGFVTETTSANLVLFTQADGLLTPRREKVLPGISQSALFELADELGLRHAERDLLSSDVLAGDEAYLTSTSPCVVPVVRLNGQPIGAGTPGPVFSKLLAAWSKLVGLDVAAQAERFAVRD